MGMTAGLGKRTEEMVKGGSLCPAAQEEENQKRGGTTAGRRRRV